MQRTARFACHHAPLCIQPEATREEEGGMGKDMRPICTGRGRDARPIRTAWRGGCDLEAREGEVRLELLERHGSELRAGDLRRHTTTFNAHF